MAKDIDPSTLTLTDSQAQRLAKVSGIDVGELTGLSVTDISAKLGDRKSTRLNSSHSGESRMPSSA